jgi:hypothetical protein
VMMGQGRQFAYFWLCIVLVATAMQGITPDAQDLASLKLLRMICSTLGSDFGSPGEDEPAPEVCEPFRMDQGARNPQGANEIPPPGLITITTWPETFSPDGRLVASLRNQDLWPNGLILSPGRLRC